MRSLSSAVAPLVIIALAGATPWAASLALRETEHVTRTIGLEPGGTLRLKSFSGRVTITASDRPEVTIDAVRRGSRERLDHIKLDIHRDGDKVVVDANRRESGSFLRHNNVVETDFDITVPRKTNIDIDVFSAPVSVQGVEGSYNVHTFSSRVKLDEAVGSIRANTFSGPVEIQAATWQAGQTIDVRTFSGNVELRVPDNARGTVTFKSFSGRLKSDVPLTLHGSSRRSMTAELGGGNSASNLRVRTFSGSVRIGR